MSPPPVRAEAYRAGGGAALGDVLSDLGSSMARGRTLADNSGSSWACPQGVRVNPWSRSMRGPPHAVSGPSAIGPIRPRPATLMSTCEIRSGAVGRQRDEAVADAAAQPFAAGQQKRLQTWGRSARRRRQSAEGHRLRGQARVRGGVMAPVWKTQRTGSGRPGSSRPDWRLPANTRILPERARSGHEAPTASP